MPRVNEIAQDFAARIGMKKLKPSNEVIRKSCSHFISIVLTNNFEFAKANMHVIFVTGYRSENRGW